MTEVRIALLEEKKNDFCREAGSDLIKMLNGPPHYPTPNSYSGDLVTTESRWHEAGTRRCYVRASRHKRAYARDTNGDVRGGDGRGGDSTLT